MFKNKNQRIPWLLLIILLISIIIIITPFGKSFLEFISPHGNNHFYLINTSNNKLNELTAMNGKIIFGSTTFEYKSINYLAYIEATNLRNAKYIYDFKYAPFTDLSNITQTKLDIPLDNHLTGLTSFTSNSSILNDFIFSAIYSNGTTQSNEVTKII